MTKTSANPRKYSKGADKLNPEQPINVYLELKVPSNERTLTIGRISAVHNRHKLSEFKIVQERAEAGELIIIVEVSMGPARAALQGTSEQVNAGYQFIWDLVKTLYYARPIFCAPPHLGDEERELAAAAIRNLKNN
jgi:hypothetical protein